ncbi:hypothetical protein Cs7R123_64360 [Catellatospora sp. TT07R-123]|nr:hypothetical protein Cs7R123_64360 [Catellatospora sp. TT07R-123]
MPGNFDGGDRPALDDPDGGERGPAHLGDADPRRPQGGLPVPVGKAAPSGTPDTIRRKSIADKSRRPLAAEDAPASIA